MYISIENYNMKKYKKAALNIAFLTMILSSGITSSALANYNYNNDLDTDVQVSESQITRQNKINNSIENNDYSTWLKMVGQNSKVGAVIDNKSFESFIEARIAARQGEYDKAIKITEDLKTKLKV